ncbi:hypothetical protein PspLS_05110 [Pyricularia sp. CBS 133598]|nr:hypothetical protein PspLS_05110 [Pyricularia sp. CBS 133598]
MVNRESLGLAQLLQAGGPEPGPDLLLLDGVDVLLPVWAGPLVHGGLRHVGGGKHDGAGVLLSLVLRLTRVLRLLALVLLLTLLLGVAAAVGDGQAVDALAVEQHGAAVGAADGDGGRGGGGGVLGQHGPAEAVVGHKVVGLGAVDAGVGGGGHGGRLAAQLDGVVGDGLHAVEAVQKVQGRDGQAVDHDGEEHQEEDGGAQRLHHVVADHVARLAHVREQVLHVLDVEDGAHADGTKVPHEQGLLPALDAGRHGLVRGHDGGDAAERQHHEAQADETREGDASALGVVELGPGHDDAHVHEAGEVEEDVDGRVDLVVALLRLGQVLAVPVEAHAGAEAGQQVVGSERAGGADDPHGNGDGEQEVALVVDPLLAQAEPDHLAAAKADHGAVDDGQEDGVQPRLEEPVPEDGTNAAVETTNVTGAFEETVCHLGAGSRSIRGAVAVFRRLEDQTRELGVAHEIGGQHQEGKDEAVVGTGLGADNLTQRTRHVLVGKGALGDGLAQHGIRRREARGDDEAAQQRELGDGGHDAGRAAQPRDGHGGQQEDRHVLPPLDGVLGWELEPGNHQLHRDHDSHEAERDFALVLFTERSGSPSGVV